MLAELGDAQEDKPFIIREIDLSRLTDVDGDELSVINLKVAAGQGGIKAGDAGTWVFTPKDNWNGKVTLDYQVTDGELLWQNPGKTEANQLQELSDFEGGGWHYSGRGGVFVNELDGWKSETGKIEIQNNRDNQGQAASGCNSSSSMTIS